MFLLKYLMTQVVFAKRKKKSTLFLTAGPYIFIICPIVVYPLNHHSCEGKFTCKEMANNALLFLHYAPKRQFFQGFNNTHSFVISCTNAFRYMQEHT